MGAGGLTISRSHTSIQNSISALYSYRAPVQPALGPLIKMECECDVIEGRSTRLSFFLFLYYAYSIILNDRLCRIYLFCSAALFTVLQDVK